MNRLDRIVAILIQLQSKRVVRAADMARRFGVSLRTLYRDMRTLEAAGLPILSEAGVGYSLVEGYRLPPIMFTADEAMALLTAEKLAAHLTDAAMSSIHQSAMLKIRAVLRHTEKDMLAQIETRLNVWAIRRPAGQLDEISPLQPVLQAIAEQKVLAIDYVDQQERLTRRTVEPVGVSFMERYWYLTAYCRLRTDYRQFRLDRIRRVEPLPESFSQDHPSLQTFLSQPKPQHPLTTVRLYVPPTLYRHLLQERQYHGFVSEIVNPNGIEMTFETPSLESMARWFMLFGDQAQILEPESLQQRVEALAEAILKKK